jgi:mannose-1-phosphate guanylyltransferase
LSNQIKAVILVGGQGTRLRPLTCNTQKSMVPVLNVPFLEHVIRNLKAHNITDIILAQHHLAASMVQYFNDGSRFGVNLTYVMEDFPRGSAGAIKNAERYLNDTFFVLNGDIFHNRNFTDMLAFHRNHNAIATIDLAPIEDPTIYGMVDTEADGRVKRFIEKPKREEISTNLINAGTWIFEPEVLKLIPPDIKYSFEREVFPVMIHDNMPLFAYTSYRYWMDIGTPEKYLQLHRDLLNNKCDGYTFTREVLIAENCQIHSAAKLSGRIMIGSGCTVEAGAQLSGSLVIGAGCNIGQKAQVKDSVLWDNVRIDENAMLHSCAIANDCQIGREVHLEDGVLGDHITLLEGSSPEKGARFFPENSDVS